MWITELAHRPYKGPVREEPSTCLSEVILPFHLVMDPETMGSVAYYLGLVVPDGTEMDGNGRRVAHVHRACLRFCLEKGEKWVDL